VVNQRRPIVNQINLVVRDLGARYAVVADPVGNYVGLMGPIDGARRRVPSPPGA